MQQQRQPFGLEGNMANGGNNDSDRGNDTHWQKRKRKRKLGVITGNK